MSSEDFANRKSPVRIATWLSQRALADVGAATHRSLVHHVVVVERADVGELDDARGGDDLVGLGVVTHLRGEQHEQRSEPLPTGGQQVRGGLGDVGGPAPDVAEERVLDDLHPALQPVGQRCVGHGQRQPDRGRSGGHRMNSPARPARSRTGPGTTPSTRVTAAPIAMTAAVSTEGCVTLGASPAGSVKYISRMTRT